MDSETASAIAALQKSQQLAEEEICGLGGREQEAQGQQGRAEERITEAREKEQAAGKEGGRAGEKAREKD